MWVYYYVCCLCFLKSVALRQIKVSCVYLILTITSEHVIICLQKKFHIEFLIEVIAHFAMTSNSIQLLLFLGLY